MVGELLGKLTGLMIALHDFIVSVHSPYFLSCLLRHASEQKRISARLAMNAF